MLQETADAVATLSVCVHNEEGCFTYSKYVWHKAVLFLAFAETPESCPPCDHM